MTGTMKLPGVGDVKKSYVYIGAAGTAGFIGLAYYRNKKNAAAAATTPTAATDPNAVDPSIDPATGLPYSQESGGGIQGGGVSGYGGSYYGSGQITGYDQYGNPVYSTGITGNLTQTTNSGWASQAENDLQASGIDSTTASSAISRILAGLTVTSAQHDIFFQAIGLDGQPPQGYPQPIKVVDSPAQPAPTPTPTPTPTPKPTPKPSVTPARTITVPAGATLASIARQYMSPGDAHDVTLIAHANGLGTGAGLKAGQKLTIPAH